MKCRKGGDEPRTGNLLLGPSFCVCVCVCVCVCTSRCSRLIHWSSVCVGVRFTFLYRVVILSLSFSLFLSLILSLKRNWTRIYLLFFCAGFQFLNEQRKLECLFEDKKKRSDKTLVKKERQKRTTMAEQQKKWPSETPSGTERL